MIMITPTLAADGRRVDASFASSGLAKFPSAQAQLRRFHPNTYFLDRGLRDTVAAVVPLILPDPRSGWILEQSDRSGQITALRLHLVGRADKVRGAAHRGTRQNSHRAPTGRCPTAGCRQPENGRGLGQSWPNS